MKITAGQGNVCRTGFSLDYSYFKDNYALTLINLTQIWMGR